MNNPPKPESLRQKLMAKAGMKADAPEVNQTEESEMANNTVASMPWKVAKDNPEIMKLVRAYKSKLEKEIEDWGEEHGIDDLALQHIMTMAKNPDAKVSYYWNPDPKKLEWFRYRDGDDVPRWLESLTNRKSYKYPDGSALTDEMKAKFKGRGSGSKKLTSLD